ncbi:MAG: 2-oxo acid dehydrogenase subunit E2 [Candidatus Tectomicrobia bacterium]|uniref:Dihydrolipoamide acetyltransferase component of pyruvate dehydrogenase complex n=1 Tax=Tectimicrobiota bacterium TaxID=2528274 RepID=A0A933GKN9_UNCTE|nr:2-oxo acid dehydrogenase subunit E2 [Candidatus Tectomicrobia bacterium]
MAWNIIMPKLGMTMKEGRVVEWLVKEGEKVKKGQIILQIESDKIQFEVEAPESGIIGKIFILPSEDSLPVGQVLAILLSDGETYSPESLFSPTSETALGMSEDATETTVALSREITSEPSGAERLKASPVARKLAQEKGVDLAGVKGTGPGGRITREDVENFLLNQPSTQVQEQVRIPAKEAIKEKVAEPAGSVSLGTVIPLSRHRKIIAQRLTTSYSTVPHIYLFSEIESTELKATRSYLFPLIKAETGHDLSYNDILMKLVAASIVQFPLFNASLEGDNIRVWDDINIGLAVATDDGLIVPVLKAVQKKSLREIVPERAGLVERALSRKLAFSDVEAGTFTISNLGMYGVDYFTAIINPPQTGILTVGKMMDKPCVVNGQLTVRSVMQLGIAADHRVVDGAVAASFLQDLKMKLEKLPHSLI